MQRYEYTVIPAPDRGDRSKGAKTPTERYAAALAEAINTMAADGWDYLRAETSERLAGQAAEEGDCAEPFTRSIADQNAQGHGINTVFVLQPRKNAECGWQ